MKLIFFVFGFLAFVAVHAQHENHTTQPANTAAQSKSPRKTAMAQIGKNHVHIDYGSPSVRGRNIWNGLVAYNQVWATGAHKATWIDFSTDVMLEGKKVSKCKYGFFTIPGKDEWVLILSKDWDMHLADAYKPENDAFRITVKPTKNKDLTEALTYKVIKTSDKEGRIEMSWEHITVALQFENLK